MISLDGYFSGPNGELDWHNVDTEFTKYAATMLDSVDTILFGRTTYEFMAKFWPTEFAIRQDPIIAEKMNSISKIVFSKTLHNTSWNNSRIIKDLSQDSITRLKHERGRSMVILGSGSIVSQLTRLELIDEYRLIVNPVILGEGIPMFADIRERINLNLLKARRMKSGNVILYYTKG